jgi:hypothetical protein
MIHHQFPGIELASPVYASNFTTYYLSPDQIVDADSTMQAGFNIDPTQDESIAILMYKLQRKNIDQFDEKVIFNGDDMHSAFYSLEGRLL